MSSGVSWRDIIRRQHQADSSDPPRLIDVMRAVTEEVREELLEMGREFRSERDRREQKRASRRRK